MIPVHDSVVSLVNVDEDVDKEYLNDEIVYLRKKQVIEEIIRKCENIFDVLEKIKILTSSRKYVVTFVC